MRIFDTILYDGDWHSLIVRFRALVDVVDGFVIVERPRANDGKGYDLTLRSRWTELADFHHKLRYIVLGHDPNAFARSPASMNRSGIERGLLDAQDEDWVLVAQARLIPQPKAVAALRHQSPTAESIPLDAVDVSGEAATGASALVFGLLLNRSLPLPVVDDRRICGSGAASSQPPRDPVIICPYVRDSDRERVIEAFGLDSPRGRHLPFHLWQDTELIGPERAFQACWRMHPGRDVIIVHTDMRPLPDDYENVWFDRLVAASETLSDAGMIACDLLFPVRHPSGHWYVQCAGGFVENGMITHVGGFVDVARGSGTAQATRYDDRFLVSRPVDWVTFGGVYIRREVIDMVGCFDPGYRWAYVMDVDYSFEAIMRGTRLYQVPINLLHEENGSTRDFLHDPERLAKIRHNQAYFHDKWRDRLCRIEDRKVRTHSSFGAHAGDQDRLSQILLAEARARGLEFEISAFVRALDARVPIVVADVGRAYELVLGRAADPIGLAWWEGRIAQASVSPTDLITALCGSAEYTARLQTA